MLNMCKLESVRYHLQNRATSLLYTSCGIRDPSPLIGYVHANTIPTDRFLSNLLSCCHPIVQNRISFVYWLDTALWPKILIHCPTAFPSIASDC